jgi:hypothetical protein
MPIELIKPAPKWSTCLPGNLTSFHSNLVDLCVKTTEEAGLFPFAAGYFCCLLFGTSKGTDVCVAGQGKRASFGMGLRPINASSPTPRPTGD